jgi:four helix bundle protein
MEKDEQLKKRTKQFSIRIIRLVKALPRDNISEVIGKQLLRSGTSVGANYRAACRSKSTKDFIYKLAIVEEEADESLYWMELLIETGVVEKKRLEDLMKEGDEVLAMVVSSIKTSRKKLNKKKSAA